MAASVTAGMAGLMTEEASVNGVWIGILATHFPYPTYIIAPEARNNDSSRVDLMVRRVADGKNVFVLEGKRAITSGDVNRNFASNAQQIIGYLGHIMPRSSQAYGVVAAGTKYAIVRWDGSNLTRMNTTLQKLNDNMFPGELRDDAANIDTTLTAVVRWTVANIR